MNIQKLSLIPWTSEFDHKILLSKFHGMVSDSNKSDQQLINFWRPKDQAQSLKYKKTSILLGPKLPYKLEEFTMISSPTEKGVLIIGGSTSNFVFTSDILELSGDSIDTLEWKILDQKLQHARSLHISFSVSNEIAAMITMN